MLVQTGWIREKSTEHGVWAPQKAGAEWEALTGRTAYRTGWVRGSVAEKHESAEAWFCFVLFSILPESSNSRMCFTCEEFPSILLSWAE